jgi:peptide/nickel transport system substrate-binding protein
MNEVKSFAVADAKRPALRKWPRRLTGPISRIVAVMSLTLGLIITISSSGNPLTAAAATSHAQGGTLTIGSASAPNSLSPLSTAQDVPFQWFNDLAYEPIIQIAANGKLVPGLATSWNFVGTGFTTFDLNLRSGVKFSDGTPLTAAGMVDWINYILAQGAKYSLLSGVTSVTATGPLQVQLQLSTPDEALPQVFTPTNEAYSYVVSDAALNSPTQLTALGSSTDGAGEYELDAAATTTGSVYTYVPNPDYYDPSAVYWSKIVIQVIGNQNTMLAALQDGQIDVAQGSPTIAPSAVSAGFKVVSAPNNLYNMTVSDPGGADVKALGSVKVRQALAYAINRPDIAKALFGKYATTDEETGGVGSPGIVPGLEHYYGYNLKEAKLLMKEAGYPHGFTANVLVTSAQLGMEQMTEAVAQEWKAIGVKLVITDPPQSVWVTDLLTKKWDFLAIGWPYYNLNLWTASVVSATGPFNYYKYPYPQLTSLEKELNTIPSGTVKAKGVEQALENAIIRGALIVPVTTQDVVLLRDKRVDNISSTPVYPVPNPIYWTPTS